MTLQSQRDAIPGCRRQKVTSLFRLSNLDGNSGGHSYPVCAQYWALGNPNTRYRATVNPAQYRASMT